MKKIKFRNLKIGYYFIFEEKAFHKVSDFGAIQLFSYLDAPLFSNVNSRFFNVNEKLEYERPARILCNFEPDDQIGFIKKEDLRKYLSEIYLKTRKEKEFRNLKIGSYFFNKNDKLYYKKISYDKAFPLYKDKVGIKKDTDDVIISTISSALLIDSDVNKLYYNGEKLIDYNLNNWNIVWFEDNFTNYTYASFNLNQYYDRESKSMLEFLSLIPNNAFTIILNSNDSYLNTNIDKDIKYSPLMDIIKENEKAENIFESFGLTLSVIENIKTYDSFLMVCKKDNEILHYKRLKPNTLKDIHYTRDNYAERYLEYTYVHNSSSNQPVPGLHKIMDLKENVIEVTLNEITVHNLLNLNPLEEQYLSSYHIFDM